MCRSNIIQAQNTDVRPYILPFFNFSIDPPPTLIEERRLKNGRIRSFGQSVRIAGGLRN